MAMMETAQQWRMCAACRYYTQTGRIENEEVLNRMRTTNHIQSHLRVKNSQIRRKPNVAD